MSDIVNQLRERACPAGLPWTADDPRSDHGHTDCWLMHQAADEIDRLRNLISEWADAEDAWGHPSIDRVNSAVDNLRAVVGK